MILTLVDFSFRSWRAECPRAELRGALWFPPRLIQRIQPPARGSTGHTSTGAWQDLRGRVPSARRLDACYAPRRLTKAFAIGADVAVRTLGNKRGVVIAVGGHERYRVRVEGVTIWCLEDDLAAPPDARKKKSAGPRRQDTRDAAPPDAAVPPSRVDLHGLRVDEAMTRVVDEIDHALRRGADRVEVIHGKGAGRIKDALHRQLASMPVVSAFKLDPRNAGVTWVYF